MRRNSERDGIEFNCAATGLPAGAGQAGRVRVRRIVISLILAAFVFAVGVLATTGRAQADASDALQHVLEQVRFMGGSDFTSLVKWARNGTPKPDDATFQPQKVEVDILNLSDGDRNAILYWLQGKGRSALFAQGASDSQIGPRRDFEAPTATPTPNAWRNIPLATASIEGANQGPIQILGGFAAVKRDGSSAIACLSFKNVDSRVASHIVFEFPLIGEDGQSLGSLVLDRHGEFSPNIDIVSYGSMQGWQSSSGPRTYGDGCIQRTLPTAALPFLQARASGYHVVHVDFLGGGMWPPGALPAPPQGPPPGAPVPAPT